MARLSVNVDHVATIRQARRGVEPDPVTAAQLAELAGADGIIVHLREDRRHIQDRDLYLLREVVKTRLNLEMAATEEMLGIALKVRPHMVTLVPERREELTTEGGIDVVGKGEVLKVFIDRLHEGGMEVSLFVDPEPDQIREAKRIGADIVEIHTGPYSECTTEEEEDRELERVRRAVGIGRDLRLRIHAGHGLNYRNIKRIACLEGIEEFSIGHSIIARSVFVGIERAVREMIDLIRSCRGAF